MLLSPISEERPVSIGRIEIGAGEKREDKEGVKQELSEREKQAAETLKGKVETYYGLEGEAVKIKWKMTREKWLLFLLAGVFLMLLSVPGGEKKTVKEDRPKSGEQAAGTEEHSLVSWDISSSFSSRSYEERLEKRIRELLRSVEGVGQVDVMVVLKSTGQKVLRVDRSGSSTVTKETDSAGGSREITESQSEESTVLPQSGGGSNGPVVEKELCPEISGIVVSADGGGSPEVCSEISQAMEALLGLPAHKIKVLKRVE